jgi:hypothetical protein
MNMHEYGYASTYYIHILYGYEYEYIHAYSYKALFEYSYSHVCTEGLKHLQLGIVLLRTVACELSGCFNKGDWLLFSSRGRVRGGGGMGELGPFRGHSSRDRIERRRRRLSRPPEGGRDPNRSIHDSGAVL